MSTIQAAIDVAVQNLNDIGNIRYSEEDLIGYYNDAVMMARRMRPDLFVYAYSTPIVKATAATDTFQLPDGYEEAVGYYMAGRAEFRDDEFALDGRAMISQKRFVQLLQQGV